MDDLPNLRYDHAIIVVDQEVSQSSEHPPGNLGIFVHQRFGDSFRGLANDLQIPNHRVLQREIAKKDVAPSGTDALNPLDTLHNVQEIEAIVLHSGLASAST